MLLVYSGMANPVDIKSAQKVAENFLSAKKSQNLVLNKVIEFKKGDLVTFFAFSSESGGFVLVSADDNVKPILAYSDNSTFSYPVESPEVKWWLEYYSSQIYSLVKSGKVIVKNQELWKRALANDLKVPKTQVGPLLKTTWSQTGGGDIPYNYYCPTGTPVGCVATASIQVMKYWEYPVHGIGWFGYNAEDYGFLSVDLEQRDLDWANMPLDASNDDVALIGYQVGVTLRMHYSPSGSGSYGFNLTYILPNFFGYDQGLMYYERDDIGDSWADTLKRQLDLGQPIIYSGHSDNGGHAFVCDGYDGSGLFHFNWGWGGYYDGWFSLDKLNPGDSHDYSSDQSAIINIKPAANVDRLPAGGQANLDKYDYFKLIKAVDAQAAYALSDDGKFLSTTTGGIKWNEVTIPTNSFNDLIAVGKKDLLLVSSDGKKVYYSIDGAKEWKILNLPNTDVSWLLSPSKSMSEIHLIGLTTNGMVAYMSSDTGNTWTQVNITSASGEKPISLSSLSNAFATDFGNFYYYENGEWKSDNIYTGSNKPVDVKLDLSSAAGAVALIKDADHVSNLYLFDKNNNPTWTKITPTFPSGVDLNDALDVELDDGLNIYLLLVNGLLLRSTDKGQNFKYLAEYYQLFPFKSMEFAGDYGYIGAPEKPWSPGSWFYGASRTAEVKIANSAKRLCISSAINFSADVLGIVDSLRWYFGEDATPKTSTNTKQRVTYSTGGNKTVSVVVYSPNGYDKETYSFYLDEYIPGGPELIDGPNLVKVNEKYNFSVPEENNVDYVWLLPSDWKFGDTENNSNSVYLIPQGTLGTVAIKAAYQNGCGATDYAEKTVTVVAGNEQVAYPNPTSDFVNIENAENAKVEVYSYNGRLLKTFVSNSYLYKIDLSDLNNGAYFVKVYRPDKDPVVFKVIVNK